MRKYFQAVGLGAVVAVSFAAYAADSLDVKPESRAYLNFDFGGSREQVQEFHYGLQFGQRAEFSRDRELLRPESAIKLDYSNIGNSLLVNGRPLVDRSNRLHQSETAPAADAAAAPAAEEPGFFGKIGNWFSGLFGGGEEPAAAAAPATEGAAAAEPGFFDNYTIADYALLGVGVVGVGYAISQVAKGDDSPDPAAGSSSSSSSSSGGGPLGGILCDPITMIGCFTSTQVTNELHRDASYAEWLDGGNGQMGDLVAQ